MFLPGCAGDGIQRGLADVEKRLETDTEATLKFHEAAYFPWAVQLHHPGMIVGVEKSPRAIVAPGDSVETSYDRRAGEGIQDKVERIHADWKTLFISQVYEYSGKKDESACAHYSVYEAHSHESFMQPCSGEHVGAVPDDAFRGGWTALNIVRERVEKRISEQAKKGDAFTHVLLLVMGWNTSQIEAYRNFNSILGNMHATRGEERFNPLVIGVTWPSLWSSSWLQPIIGTASYVNKANDADELGLGWLGLVARDVLAAVDSPDIETVMVGHSFGARAAATAACVGPVLSQAGGMRTNAEGAWSIDTVIALQPAFSINRFFSADDDDFLNESIHFPSGCAHVQDMVMTASRHDTAVHSQPIADMVGDIEQHSAHCANENWSAFRCATMRDDRLVGYSSGNEYERILYVDASESIRLNSPGTGGGGHSDIYREQGGRMMWSFLRAVESMRTSGNPGSE